MIGSNMTQERSRVKVAGPCTVSSVINGLTNIRGKKVRQNT